MARHVQNKYDMMAVGAAAEVLEEENGSAGDSGEYYQSRGWDFFARLIKEEWTKEEEYAYRAIVCIHEGQIDELKVQQIYI